MKTFKGKIIDSKLEGQINELNFNIKLLRPGEWKNPKSETAKLIKTKIINLQTVVDNKLKTCPDYKDYTAGSKYLTQQQKQTYLEFLKLKLI